MADPNNRREEKPILRGQKPGFFARLRNNFLTGVVVAAPIGITFWLIWLFITGPVARLDEMVRGLLPSQFTPTQFLEYLPGFGLIMAMIALILLGAMAKNFIGRSLIGFGERLVDSIPGVRNLYGFFKNVFEMALQQSERSFKEVALIEYPRPGLWALAFVVTRTKGEVSYKLRDTQEEMVSIFVPTTPNPTSGFLLFVPLSEVRILDMTVEDGAKLIFSAGLVTPHYDPDEYVSQLEEAAQQAEEGETSKKSLPFNIGRGGRGKKRKGDGPSD